MAFDRSQDPERREALKRKRREMLAQRREALKANPVFVAAQLARKQAQKEYRHAAYVAAKARRPPSLRTAIRRDPQPEPEPEVARETGETSAPARKSNVIPFRRRA